MPFNISSNSLNTLSTNLKSTIDKLNNISSIEKPLKEKLLTKYPTVTFSINKPKIRLDNQAIITKQIREVSLPKQVQQPRQVQLPKQTELSNKPDNRVKIDNNDIKSNIINTLLKNDT